MFNHIQLNRIHRILSAKTGAQVPKFQQPAGSIFPTDKQYYIAAEIEKLSTADPDYSQKVNKIIENAEQIYSDTSNDKVTKESAIQDAIKSTLNPLIGLGGEALTKHINKNSENQGLVSITKEDWLQLMEQGHDIKNMDDNTAYNLLHSPQKSSATVSITNGTTPIGEEPKLIDAEAGNPNAEAVTMKFNAEKYGNIAEGISKGADIANAMLIDKADYAADSSVNSTGSETFDVAMDTIGQAGSYGQMISAAGKTIKTVLDATGKKSDSFTVDQKALEQVGAEYGGSVDTLNNAAQKAGKKYSVLDGKKRRNANAEIAEAKRQQGIIQDIAKDTQDRQDSATYMANVGDLNYQYQMNGGYDQRYMRAAKSGGSLTQTADFQVILTDPEEPIVAFKSGGKATEIKTIETDTTQKSVIPEGALHKNKHHLDEVGVDDSELTKKGIPVIDNEGNQQAEIELNEIIFTLEVTKELESRYKKYYEEGTSQSEKDKLALEAGKLLWKEILYNTDDKTGLIDTLKQGGILSAQKGNKVIKKPEYSEWVKDVNPDFINDNYDLETAYKYLPYEQMERWKYAVNSPNPDKYLNYQDPKTGEYSYHLLSVAPLDNGDYIFLKKGTERTNPELHWETDTYYNGTNGLKKTHDLVYDDKEGRYFYRKRTVPKKHQEGGVIERLEQDEITKMVKQALINILLSND